MRGSSTNRAPGIERRVRAGHLGVDDAVRLARDDEGGDADRAEPVGQRGVGHRRPAVDRERGPVAGHRREQGGRHGRRVQPEPVRLEVAEVGDLVQRECEEVGRRVVGHGQPDGADEGEVAPAVACRLPDEGGQLGGDPPADRVPDDRQVVQVEVLDQRGVGGGEPAGAVERGRSLGAAEPGVGRDEDPDVGLRGQPLGERRDRHRSRTAVQEQDGTAVAVLVDADRDATDPSTSRSYVVVIVVC